MRRLTCFLFGCQHDGYMACMRCGVYDQDDAFRRGVIPQWRWRFYQWRRENFKRCEHCGKLMLFAGSRYTCSEKCLDELGIPF